MKTIEQKHRISRTNCPSEFRKISKEVKTAAQNYWEQWLANIKDKDLDLRDKRLGIKFLKSKYAAKTYERADRPGKQVGFREEANAAADYLHNEQWGDRNEHLFDRNEKDKLNAIPRIVKSTSLLSRWRRFRA